MKLGKIGIILLLLFGLLQLQAQDPDYLLESLNPVKGTLLIDSENDLHAKVSLYSFEDYLSLVVEVKDDFKDINRGEYLTDHIELFFALPTEAYPDEFKTETHPYYLYSPPLASRSTGPLSKSRFFSSLNTQLKDKEVSAFLEESEYPANPVIRNDSLNIPFSSQLSRKRIDYGIVHYGLFLDERTPLLYNKKYHQIIEQNLNFKIGAVESGITYVVDQVEDGYTLTAQIEPKALGFVKLPEMNKIRFSLDVVDTDGIHQDGFSVLSVTGAGGHSMKDRAFIEVPLQRPLKTNFSETPDRVYRKTNYFPTYTYTESGWVPTAIEIDALYYKNQAPSHQFCEIQFIRRPQSYELQNFPHQYLTLEQLSIDYEYVNLLGRTVHYTLIHNHVFRSQLMRRTQVDSTSPPPMQVFFFPDGEAGLLLSENATLSPYGWGENGHTLDERIRIFRVNREKPLELLRVEQGNGESPYCHIGKLNYEGFFVEKINWAKKGEIMVILLKSRLTQARKRLRVTWQADGSELEIQELP